MMSASLALALLAALSLLLTVSVSSASGVHLTRSHSSTAWQLAVTPSSPSSSSRASPDAAHSFLWLFPTTNDDWLQQQFEAVSEPSSPRYLQHLTFDELQAKTGPSAADKAAVTAWLGKAGVSSGGLADYGHALSVQTTVGVVERLFNTSVHRFVHAHTHTSANVAVDGAYIPALLADKLASLHGVYDHPVPISGQLTTHRKPQPVQSAPSSPAPSRFHSLQAQQSDAQCPASYRGNFFFAIAPDAIAAAYNYSARYTDTALQPTRAGVAGGFDSGQYNEAFSQTDLNRFRAKAGFSAPFVATQFSGNNAANLAANVAAGGAGPTDEATLDIQALFQTSPTSNNSFIAVTGSQTLLNSLTAIAAMSASVRPQVVSYSYGFGYSDYNYYRSTDGPATEQALLRLAVLGVTVVVSSGDDGTQGAYNRQCATNTNTALGAQVTPSAYAASPMLPQYPASSAYVLSVSETAFLGNMAPGGYGQYFSQSVTSPPLCNNCPANAKVAFLCQSELGPENPVSTTNAYGLDSTTTGGGFSFVFGRPAWQAAAVTNYLKVYCAAGNANNCKLPAASAYNASGRAYPDVSAFGAYFPIQANGTQQVMSGTSVAAPIWAGLIARLNEVAIARTGSPLGFVNALFHAMAAAQPSTFNDIALGNNICPQNNAACVSAVNKSSSTNCQGFMSTVGWDPVTGLGSPNIGNMLAYLNATLRSNASSPTTSSSSTSSPARPSSSSSSTASSVASRSSSTGATNPLWCGLILCPPQPSDSSTAADSSTGADLPTSSPSASSTPNSPSDSSHSSAGDSSSSSAATGMESSDASSASESSAPSSSSSSSTAVKVGATHGSSGRNGAATTAEGAGLLVGVLFVLSSAAIWF